MKRPGNLFRRFTPRFSSQAVFRGQGLVEFVLVLPILLFSIFMLIDLSRAAYDFIVLTNAVREASRIGVAQCVNGTYVSQDCVKSEVIKRSYGVIPEPEPGNITVSVETISRSINEIQRPESNLTVRILYTYSPVTPFLGEFLDGSVIEVDTSSSMQIE